MAENKTRWEEIKEIWRNADYRVFYKVLGWTVLILLGVVMGKAFFSNASNENPLTGYWINVFTSVLSTVFTVTVIEIFNRKRAEDEHKRQLVDDAASLSNEIAKNAVHQLRRKGWLEGEKGLLQGANLRVANLRDVHLAYANMRKASLVDADLRGADLNDAHMKGAILANANAQGATFIDADLEEARLHYADLQAAILGGTNLKGAYLRDANLQKAKFGDGATLEKAILEGANLQETSLQGVNLRGANLSGAMLSGTDFTNADLREAVLSNDFFGAAGFDDSTILPDGSQWTEATDMRWFTDPTYSGFWQSPLWTDGGERADVDAGEDEDEDEG